MKDKTGAQTKDSLIRENARLRERLAALDGPDGGNAGGAVAVDDIAPLLSAERAVKLSAERFELLAATAGDLLRARKPQSIIEALCRRVMEHLNCQAFFNFMVDDRSGRLRLNACAGIPDEEALKIEWLDFGSAVCGCAARDGCRIVAEHIPSTPDERTLLVKSYGITAYACHPLFGEGGRVIGTLSFGTRVRETFSEDDLTLMKAVADQVAVALVRIRDEEALRRNETMLQGILDAAKESIWLFDPGGVVLKANRTALKRFGRPPEQVMNKFIGDFLPPDLARSRMTHLKKAVETAGPVDFEDERNGVIFHHSLYPVLDDKDGVLSVASFIRDITENKRSEKELRSLNRTLKALGKSSQAIMRAADETGYLNEVCRIIVEDCGHTMVWIGFAEHDEARSVRPAAYAGFDEGYVDTLRITWADTERGRGPTGTAIRTGKPSFSRDMHNDPDFRPWREEAVKRGYRSSLVLPLMGGDGAFGALNIYSTEPDPFTDNEARLLLELADDLAQGILTIRLREAHAKAEELLRQSDERHRTLFETIIHGVVYQDAHGAITAANPAAQRILGLSLSQMQGRTPLDPQWKLIRESGSATVEVGDLSMEALRTGRPVHNAVLGVFKPATGSFTWINMNAIPLFRAGNSLPSQVYTIFEDVTERKNSEIIIKRLASFPELNPNPIIEVSVEGNVLYFNASARKIFPGLQLQRLTHPYLADLEKDLRRFTEGAMEFTMREVDVGASTYQQYLHYLKDEHCVRIYGFDITTRKRAEDAHQETNILLTAIVDNTDLLIAYLDRDFNYIRVNRAFAAADGKDISFFPGKNHFSINPSPELLETFKEAVETGTPHFEKGKSYVYPAHSEREASYWDWSVIPIKDADGIVKNLVLTLADVTNHKNQEAILLRFNEKLDQMVHERTEELFKTNENLRDEIKLRYRVEAEKEKAYAELDTIFNSTSVGMTVINSEYRYIRVNRRFSEMVSIERSELLGKKCFELWNNDVCDSGNCPMEKIFSGETEFPHDYEMKYVNPAGRELVFQLTIVPYYSDDDTISGIISNAIDITEKREIQLKLTNIIDEERKNISYELHDDLGQNLTAMGFILESIRQKIGSPQEVIMKKIDEIGEILLLAQNKTRSLSKLLSPVETGRDGLRTSLETMAVSLERIYGIHCDLKIDDGFEIDDDNIATTLFYIAREAATNAVKHGSPKIIVINAYKNGASRGIIVRDDGTGAGVNTADAGIGLKIMKYRAQIIGASFFAGNSPQGGFEVSVRLPD